MAGVCDGHGINGHLVSNYVKLNLPKLLTEIIWTDSFDENKTNSFLPPLSSKAVSSSFPGFSGQGLVDEFATQNSILSENENSFAQES
jgi:hypothetical protein